MAWGRVAFTCLLMANWKPKKWYDGRATVEIPAGSFVTSAGKLGERACVSLNQVRRALNYMEKSDFATIKATNRYTVVTLCNWKRYQASDGEGDALRDDQTTIKRRQIKK